MNIKELIEELKKFKNQYGNIDVGIETWDEDISSGGQDIKDLKMSTVVTNSFDTKKMLFIKSYKESL